MARRARGRRAAAGRGQGGGGRTSPSAYPIPQRPNPSPASPQGWRYVCGTKRTWRSPSAMSAFGGKADIQLEPLGINEGGQITGYAPCAIAPAAWRYSPRSVAVNSLSVLRDSQHLAVASCPN